MEQRSTHHALHTHIQNYQNKNEPDSPRSSSRNTVISANDKARVYPLRKGSRTFNQLFYNNIAGPLVLKPIEAKYRVFVCVRARINGLFTTVCNLQSFYNF